MARMIDFRTVIQTVGVVPFAKRVWDQVMEDDLFTWAAALAYSWLFAVFPFMLFLLTLLPYLPERAKNDAHGEIRNLIYKTAPGRDAADTIWSNVEANLTKLLHEKQGKLIPRLVSLGLALWAASGGMNMTIAALDKCYELEGGRRFYHQRPLAMALTLAVAALLILVLSLLPVGTIVKRWVEAQNYWGLHKGSPAMVLFDVVRWTLATFFMLTVVSLVYYKGPHIRHHFRWLTPGTVFTIVVWIVLGFAFRFYVERYGKYNQTYGTVGGVAVLLMFFYIDALVLLIGAEINSEVDFEVLKIRRGTRDFRMAENLSEKAPTANPAVASADAATLEHSPDVPVAK